MDPVERHALSPDAAFDGGDLDCGGGLLLLLRQHIDPLRPGQLLEIRSTETSVDLDLPAWCSMTGNDLVSWTKHGRQRSFLVCKGRLAERPALAAAGGAGRPPAAPAARVVRPVAVPASLPAPAPAPPVPALAAMGMGSWPRPRWMLQAIHDGLEGRVSEEDFLATGDDAVRLCVDAQKRAGAHVLTDGEQRRDSYANFVGGRLDNCQLIPLTDLLPLVDDPEELRAQFESLDVPAAQVRHPVVFGRLSRARPIVGHELSFLRTLTDGPTKVALPGPYLLSRVLWLECVSEKVYASREDLAADVVRVLREEAHDLLARGASLVQFDEPVLSEVVYGKGQGGRCFMCGALSARGAAEKELAFARDLLNAVLRGLPRDRTALHVCRGNWTPDESAALTGDYVPLLDYFEQVEVGTYLLEGATPRAGDVGVLAALPDDRRIGVGVVNPKEPRVETVEEVLGRARRAAAIFGADRLLLVPDCGFATFADNPVASAAAAEGKLSAIAQASARLRA